METKYMIIFKTGQTVNLTYDMSGYLQSLVFGGDYGKYQIEYVLQRMVLPTVSQFLEHVKFKHEKWTIFEVQDDLSFMVFWDEYGYKVGNKGRAEKLWNAMQDEERKKCLIAIKKYKFFLAQNSTKRAYPETYLAQKRWENEF